MSPKPLLSKNTSTHSRSPISPFCPQFHRVIPETARFCAFLSFIASTLQQIRPAEESAGKRITVTLFHAENAPEHRYFKILAGTPQRILSPDKIETIEYLKHATVYAVRHQSSVGLPWQLHNPCALPSTGTESRIYHCQHYCGHNQNRSSFFHSPLSR